MPNPGKGNGHFLLARQTQLHPSHPFWPTCICNVSTSHHTLSLLSSPLGATGRWRNPLPLHRTHFRLASLDASLRRVALYDCMPTRRFAITGWEGEELTNERRDERTSGALSILHFLRAALRQNWQCHSVRRRTSSSTTQPNRETMAIFCLGSLSLSPLQNSE